MIVLGFWVREICVGVGGSYRWTVVIFHFPLGSQNLYHAKEPMWIIVLDKHLSLVGSATWRIGRRPFGGFCIPARTKGHRCYIWLRRISKSLLSFSWLRFFPNPRWLMTSSLCTSHIPLLAAASVLGLHFQNPVSLILQLEIHWSSGFNTEKRCINNMCFDSLPKLFLYTTGASLLCTSAKIYSIKMSNFEAT